MKLIHVLAHQRSAGYVLENDAVPHLADRAEPSDRIWQRTPSDFFRAGRRLPRIHERHALADLPPGIDPVCEPYGAVRFGKRRLPAWRLAIRMVVRAGRERDGSHAFSTPDGRDSQKIDIKGRPRIGSDSDDDAARRQVVRG